MTPPLRLLVTGAAGFIGAAVARAAAAGGHFAIRLVRTAGRSSAAFDRTVVADLTSPELADALDGVDVVVHCAASLTGGANEQARDTIAATSNLIACMRKKGVGRMVLVSSYAVYDYRAIPAWGRLNESSPLERDAHIRGPYVEAKLAQEQIVQSAGDWLDWRIVRPGLVFGPGRGWFYHLGMTIGGRVWVALAGGAELPLTYVDNCAEAILAAATSPTARIVVNIVDDERPTRAAYMSALAAATAPGVRVIDLPWALLSAGGAAAGAVGITTGMLHPARLAARCKPLTYDNTAAKALFDWRPATPMAEALQTLREQRVALT